jgi:hypothetical protein
MSAPEIGQIDDVAKLRQSCPHVLLKNSQFLLFAA